MKKNFFFSFAAALLLCGMGVNAQTVECPDAATAQTADYYLSNPYYFQCTALKDSVFENKDGSKENVKANADGLIKLTDDGWSDFHWSGTSRAIFDSINMSAAGDYTLIVNYRSKGGIDLIVNEDTTKTNLEEGASPARMKIALKEGMNTIKLGKGGWLSFYSIQLEKITKVVTTTITFDKQGGVGGTESVVATQGEAMPKITVPTREGYVFEGYFSEIEGGSQYYAMDGSSFKAWDREEEAFTLYAHWNNGSTGGDCPTAEQATSEDWYLTHMYDARCTELTNTWEKDNGAYIYTNVEDGKVKITADGQWIDFYWADPSSIVFDSIYVSEDGYYDMTWFFRCDAIDGEATAGSKNYVYVNDELFGDVTVWISDEEVELDQTKVEGIELYADFPNKIKLQKGNGWPLTRGIQLSRVGMGIRNAHTASFFVSVEDGVMTLNRLSGNSRIAIYSLTGEQVLTATTNETTFATTLPQGAYIVNVNGEYAKAVVR